MNTFSQVPPYIMPRRGQLIVNPIPSKKSYPTIYNDKIDLVATIIGLDFPFVTIKDPSFLRPV